MLFPQTGRMRIRDRGLRRISVQGLGIEQGLGVWGVEGAGGSRVVRWVSFADF